MNNKSKMISLLLLFSFVSGCSSATSLYSDISDLRGFIFTLNNKDNEISYENYQNNENIYLMINMNYATDKNLDNFIIFNGLSELPNIAYTHHYNLENNNYNMMTSNYIEIQTNILTSSFEILENNFHFISQDDNKYIINDKYEYSRIFNNNEIKIKLNDTKSKSIRGEECKYGVSISLNVRKIDVLKKMQIFEYRDEKMLRMSTIDSYKESFNLINETEYYYIKSTFTDDNGNDYVVDSEFYTDDLLNYETLFVNEFGYIDRNERYMNIYRQVF